MEKDATCDVLDFHYRLRSDVTVGVANRRQTVPTEVKLNFRLTRCPGPLAIGDIVYTTTLLPGEKVRLFTSDRRTRFTFDSSSNLSYRNTQASESSFYMQSMSESLFDVSSRDEVTSSNKSHSHVDGRADAGINILGLGGSASMSGNHDANSVSTFLGEHKQHAEASHHSAEMGVRKASSVSIGEVSARSHIETESEDHFESASREFSNLNKCHALTFLFYQINKTQFIKYELVSVERRVILDPQNDFTRVAANPIGQSTGVGVTSANILATAANRPSVFPAALTKTSDDLGLQTNRGGANLQLLAIAIRAAALKELDKQLLAEGLIDASGNVSPEAKRKFSFEKQSSLPTPGVIVKGCLDDCEVCEPALEKEIELSLERKKLENELLKKQIELLEKSQEYRCCPCEEEEEDA